MRLIIFIEKSNKTYWCSLKNYYKVNPCVISPRSGNKMLAEASCVHLPIWNLTFTVLNFVTTISFLYFLPGQYWPSYFVKGVCMLSHFSPDSVILRTVSSGLLCPRDSAGKSTGVSCHVLPGSGIELAIPAFRWILYHWATREVHFAESWPLFFTDLLKLPQQLCLLKVHLKQWIPAYLAIFGLLYQKPSKSNLRDPPFTVTRICQLDFAVC